MHVMRYGDTHKLPKKNDAKMESYMGKTDVNYPNTIHKKFCIVADELKFRA